MDNRETETLLSTANFLFTKGETYDAELVRTTLHKDQHHIHPPCFHREAL